MKKSCTILAALVTALCIIPIAQAAVQVAGELIVDVRNEDLGSGTNVWVNHATSANSVGDFSRSGGGAFNVFPGFGDGTNYANAILINNVGADSAVSALSSPSVVEGNGTCSVEAWVYATSISGNSTVAGWGSGGSYNMRSFRYNDNSGSGFFSGYSNDDGWGGIALPTDTWVYLAYTWDGSTMVGYINGQELASASLTTMTTTHNPIYLGAGRGASDAFRGYIADMRVHTGVLDASQVANNYNEGMVQPDLTPQIVGLDDQSLFEGQDLILNPLVTGGQPQTYDWSVDGGPIVTGATNSSLTVTNLTVANDGEVYTLIAHNTYGSSTNSMTLTVSVLPNYGPRTVQVDFDRGQKYSGTALAPGLGTTWNYFDTSFANITTVNDSYGDQLGGVQVKITSSASSYADSATGSPNPHALMDEYVNGSATYEITALPAGEYDLYFYGIGNAANQGTTVSIDAANGGGIASTTGNGVNFRDIYDTNSTCYVVMTGQVATAGSSFTFTSSLKTCGFQLQNAAPVIENLPDQLVFAGTTNEIVPDIAGRASSFSYQWSLNGSPLSGETNSTLTLVNNVSGDSGNVYTLVVGSPWGSDTNSCVLTVFDGDYDTFRVNLQLDCSTSNAVHYSGTAVSSDSGTQWIPFLEPTNLEVSSVTLTNVIDSQGAATEYSVTVDKVDLWNIYNATNAALGNPNPLNLMSDYLYRGPYTITIGNLPPGDYNLYVFAHGDNAGQTSVVTVDAANGGDSGTTTDVGDYRDIYQANAVSNSYLNLSATVSGSGTLSFMTSKYLNGFQLQRVTTGVGSINIMGISVSGGMANISWTADAAPGYSIESSPSLAVPSWSEVTNVPSVGTQTTSVPLSGNDAEFYRISK